jgi:hypothetical protein
VIRRRAACPQAHGWRRREKDHVRGHESSRVRPDHVSCCIVHFSPWNGTARKGDGCSPTLEQSRAGVRVSSNRDHARERRRAIDLKQRTKASRAGVVTYDSRRAWRVGLGSSKTYAIHYQDGVRFRSATGMSEVALNRRARREENARTRRDITTKARNGVVKRRPHRCSPRARGNRADQGARLIREMGRSRSYASLVRRSVMWQHIAGHRRI